jgi:hypothetical protein
MKHFLRSVGLAAAFAATAATAQHSHTHPTPAPAPAAADEKPADNRAAAPTPLLTPAFRGYRAFNPDEPPKDWRAANEEVRAAGGHIGLMKPAEPGAASHEGHHRGTPAPGGKP